MLPSDGISLQQVIDAARRLDELGTARLIAQAAELVHKAQAGGQPLGTLSPDVVLVLPAGDVALAPTGGPVRGYAAPERLRGNAGDRRSDVFALGVILWEALAHARLFVDDAAVLAGHLRPPSEHNANVPAELDAICKKALAPEPVDRYQSAKVMAAEIAAVLDDAGYPETNERIASYLATDFAPAPVPQPPVLPVTDTPSRPANQTIHGMAPLREPAKPSLAEASPRDTLQGVAPRSELEAAVAKLAEEHGRPTTKTAIMGSLASTAPLPATGSGPHRAKRDSLAERLAALNGVPAVPGLPAMPPGADPSLATAPALLDPPSAPTPTPSPSDAAPASVDPPAAAANAVPDAPAPSTIASAETVETPALVEAAATLPPAAALPPTDAAPVATAVEPSAPHPAAVVALPHPRAGTDVGGKVDPLQGWGWQDGHDAERELEDAYYQEDEGTTAKRRLVYAIGGAAAVVVVIVVAALAFGGSSDDRGTVAANKPATSAGSVDWSAPTEPPATAAAAEPAAPPTAPANSLATGSATPAAAEPAPAPPTPAPAATPPVDEPPPAAAIATVAPPPPAPAPPEPVAKIAPQPTPVAKAPPKPEPVAKTPPKPEPVAKAAARVEPKKPATRPEPVKLAKTDPRRAPVDPFATPAVRKADTRADKKREAAKPIDPYASPSDTRKPSVDPNLAYRTGIQQFARGDANGALSTFKTSLAANPGFAPTWRGIGMVYEKLGKKSQAKTAFRKYLQLSPRAGDAQQIRERMERL